MRWKRGHKSKHVEDRRGRIGRRGLAVGGLGGVAVILIGLFLGVDVSALLGGGSGGSKGGSGGAIKPSDDREREMVEFVSFVHDDLQKFWKKAVGRGYKTATLVLYRKGTRSGCGYGSAAIGPFYCPADHNVYVDLRFFADLAKRFAAPGDFAQAYVLAHELGHHVQSLDGTSARVHKMKKRQSKREANAESVKLELQADCYAGVWAHGAARRNLLEPGDLEEGLAAASAIGDDAIQEMSGKSVQPESWTHGSSAQRTRWFRRGFKSGDRDRCDTFR